MRVGPFAFDGYNAVPYCGEFFCEKWVRNKGVLPQQVRKTLGSWPPPAGTLWVAGEKSRVTLVAAFWLRGPRATGALADYGTLAVSLRSSAKKG